MNSQWLLKMFLASVGGSLASLFWPFLIALWRKQSNELTRMFGLQGAIGARSSNAEVSGPAVLRVLYRIAELVLLPFVKYTGKMLLLITAALLIALVSSAVGFGAFLQDEQTRKTLESTGLLAFFSAFTYGFTTATLVTEPLKNKIGAKP